MSEQQLLDAIKAFFGDKSRSAAETKEGLQAALEEIEGLIETL